MGRHGMRLTEFALAALLVVAAAARAPADVDVEVRTGDKITGTIAPANEVETFRFRVPRDAVLTVHAKAAKKGPALRLSLTGPNGDPEGQGSGKAVVLSKLAVATSGVHVLEVSSDDGTSTGDYSLSITWKSATTYSFPLTLDANGETLLPFGADLLAVAKFSIHAKGTVPAVNLTLLDTQALEVPIASGNALASRTGDYGLRLVNPGASAISFTAVVKVKPPKPSKRKIALTAKAIGGGTTGDFATASVLGPDGGTVSLPSVADGEPGFELTGSSVTVPAGSLPFATTILIATAPPIDTKGSTEPAGPTVLFGPEGTRFDLADPDATATVTIPFDPAFAGSTASLLVFTRDAKGKVTLVPPPYTFDGTTVTFATSHFSSFAAAAPVATGGSGDFISLVRVTDPRDITFGVETDQTTQSPIIYFVAEGTARTVGAIRIGAGGYSRERWAGGGPLTADGSNRLQFDFGGPVVAVTSDSGIGTWVATETQIFRIDDLGAVVRVAGTGSTGDSGDGGPAVDATFGRIHALLLGSSSDLFVSDERAHKIRLIAQDGTISLYAGDGTPGIGSDGVDPLNTQFVGPYHMLLSESDGLYVADGPRIREIRSGTSFINTTVAGDPAGSTGSTGDGGDPLSARFQSARGIGLDFDFNNPTSSRFIVSDSADHTIRRVELTNQKVTLLVGAHGTAGYSGDFSSLPGQLNEPVSVLGLGTLIVVCDRGNGRVRMVTLTP